MTTKEVTLNIKSGLESKPATKLIQKASGFKASIWIEKEERKANAKSLLGLLSLGIANGTKITLSADGEDEEKALKELEEYLSGGMEESI